MKTEKEHKKEKNINRLENLIYLAELSEREFEAKQLKEILTYLKQN